MNEVELSRPQPRPERSPDQALKVREFERLQSGHDCPPLALSSAEHLAELLRFAGDCFGIDRREVAPLDEPRPQDGGAVPDLRDEVRVRHPCQRSRVRPPDERDAYPL